MKIKGVCKTNNKAEIVEGIKYPTLKAVAINYGLKETRIYKRYQRGKRGDELIPLKFRKSYIAPIPIDNNKFIIGNLKFKNPTDACRSLKIDYNKYRTRLRQNWTIEEALELVPRDDKRSYFKKHSNQENPIRKKRRKSEFPLIVFGFEYKSYQQLADALNTKSYILYQRVHKYNKTLEEAILMEGKSKKIKVGDVAFDSLANCARAFGVEPNSFYHLMKSFTVEQIIGMESRITSHSLIYKGKFYPNQIALAEDYGLTRNQFYYRTYVCKMSLEEALRIDSNSSLVKSVFGNEGKLYIAEIIDNSKNDYGDNKTYKIGVTQHELEKRYKEFPFECRTVFCKDGNLSDLKEIEKAIKAKYPQHKISDYSASDFDGFSEIYELNQWEVDKLKFLIKLDKSNLYKQSYEDLS